MGELASGRSVGVHRSVVRLLDGADDGGPGAAVTAGLCGHWEHEGPCRWPHHNAVERFGDVLELRTVFVAAPEEHGNVRRRLVAGLRSGAVTGPAGPVGWELITEEPTDPGAAERVQGARLAGG